MNTRVIILAAGRGTRMASYSNVGPKCLLEFKGEPLLGRQLRSIMEVGISNISIVGGYMINKLEEFVREFSERNAVDITLLNNPFYSETNSMGSLWFAREYLGSSDVFVTNADTYFEPQIYRQLISNHETYVFGIDESRKNDQDYRVTLGENEVLNMGKDIPDKEAMAEYIGIALIREKGTPLFRELIEKVVGSGNYKLWWEDVFVELMAKNKKISYVDVTGKLWFEIDEVKDYRRYQRYF